jgi:hypothetical protein
METTTESTTPAHNHSRWCPVCRSWQAHPRNETPGPCRPRRDVIVVGLEVHVDDEVAAVCDNYRTRDLVAAFLRGL